MSRRKKADKLSKFEIAVPGFGLVERDEVLEAPDPDPVATFETTSRQLDEFMERRDPVALLSRLGMELLLAASGPDVGKSLRLEQFEVELLQSFALTRSQRSFVPTSPNNMSRGRVLARSNLMAYPHAKFSPVEGDPIDLLSRQARVQTLYYRNIFNSRDAAIIMPELLVHMDTVSEKALGYRLSDLARALFGVFDLLSERIGAQFRRLEPIIKGRPDSASLAHFLQSGAPTRRAWRWAERYEFNRTDLAMAQFQLSEICWGPVFTFTRAELEQRFGRAIVEGMFNLSIGWGELADADASRFYLDSPIRSRPFIRLGKDELFLPIPGLLVSFPFLMIEGLIADQPALLGAYAAARTDYLEEATAAILRTALPSATIFSSVHWDDPETGKHYENDVVAVLGNHIFLFEAKSGKLKPASRRGGVQSLRKNLKELYVDPGLQASRLQTFLRGNQGAQNLLKDRKGRPLAIDLSRPVVIFSFGVCIESLGTVTSSRRQFEEAGLIGPDDPFSPILSIGELRMLDAHLDTEPAFFHYLTRRAGIERVLEFHGDEQDLLSVYLTNGFHLDEQAIKGVRVVFNEADQPVRKIKIPRVDRRQFDMPGLQLPASWRRLCADLYASDSGHRFDMLETLLNLHPAALLGLEKRVQRWRSGGGGGKHFHFIFADVGERTFALGLVLARDAPPSEAAWHEFARAQSMEIYSMAKPTDVVILFKMRKSTASYDAISFFRMNKMSDGEIALRTMFRGE